MNGIFKKVITAVLIFALCIGSTPMNFIYSTSADADENIGSLAQTVTGEWSYWDGSGDVVQSNAMLLDKLPGRKNKDITRWTTQNYDDSTGAFDMGEWGTTFMWDYSKDKWGNTAYSIPMSYKAEPGGLYVSKPSTILIESAFMMEQPEDGSLTDFLIGPDFVAQDKKVDRVTAWSYDLIFTDAANSSNTMKATLTQGSPFSFYQLNGSTKMKISRMRNSLPSLITYYDGNSLETSTMIIIRTFDNQDEHVGYSNYDYYAVYVPQNTHWTQTGLSEVDGVGVMTANFSDTSNAYMSFAWLCEATGPNTPTLKLNSIDAKAEVIAKEYQKYAYNIITDTKADYSYDASTSTVTTTYSYTVDKKLESSADGTVMGILPHQYKNMSGYKYLDNTARTIRGTMKFLTGSSYETKLKYTGILPNMMDVDSADKTKLQEYINDFMEEYGPTDTSVTKEDYSVNTYDTGKKLNRAVQVMQAAEACGDTKSAQKLLNGIKAELSDWYTASGNDDEKYFYYDEDVGSLFGFPQSYYTVDGMTDHHFHYGYFINASAQVALRDSLFVKQYGNIIKELIDDIATLTENHKEARYPKLRYFSEYEGHSWASGHANFADGNNQESSSEALNAWAGLILYGQATNNQTLTEAGIYLYTTEISAVNNYWFDVDGDVLDSNFKKPNTYGNLPKHLQASMIWSGKYGYETWWTAEPLQIQGINILPMTSASFYTAKDKNYILNNFETAQKNEDAYHGEDKDINRWNEIWSVYLAMAVPDKAMDYFNSDCSPEAGDSKAHAYHYIAALQKYGTPDLTVTSDTPLASVFADSDDLRTYVVYNASENDKTVHFSDGKTINTEPHKMTVISDTEPIGKANYVVEHYIEQPDASYVLNFRETKSAKIGSKVTAVAKTYQGFTDDESF